MLHSLGVSLGRFDGRANGDQEIDHHSMAGSHPLGEYAPGFSKENATIRTRGDQFFAFEPVEAFDGA